MWPVARHPGCCVAMAGSCTAWGGVPMAAGSPVAGGMVPSGCGTQLPGTVSRSCGTSTTPTPSSMAWRGVQTGNGWPAGPICLEGWGGMWKRATHAGRGGSSLTGSTPRTGNRMGRGMRAETKLASDQTGRNVRGREADEGNVQGVKVRPDGSTLASWADDGAGALWDLERGEHLRTLRRDRPYERLDITGIRGLTGAQRATLRALGAVEDGTGARL